jgi:hypothetical protein
MKLQTWVGAGAGRRGSSKCCGPVCHSRQRGREGQLSCSQGQISAAELSRQLMVTCQVCPACKPGTSQAPRSCTASNSVNTHSRPSQCLTWLDGSGR